MSQLRSFFIVLSCVCVLSITGCKNHIITGSNQTGVSYAPGDVLVWDPAIQGTTFNVYMTKGVCKEGGNGGTPPLGTEQVVPQKDGTIQCTLEKSRQRWTRLSLSITSAIKVQSQTKQLKEPVDPCSNMFADVDRLARYPNTPSRMRQCVS